MNDTPRGSWASSIFDLKQSQADALLPKLFERASYDEVDRNNEIQRQQNRQDSIFSLYPLSEEVGTPKDSGWLYQYHWAIDHIPSAELPTITFWP